MIRIEETLNELATYNEYINQTLPYHDKIYPQTISPTTTKEQWEQYMDELDEIPDEEYDEYMGKLVTGILVIGTQGCTYDNLLVLTKEYTGNIMYIDWNLEQEYAPINIKMGFLEWIELYFKEIVDGHNLASYGYRAIISEQQIRQTYIATADVEDKIKMLDALYRYNKLEEQTLDFLEKTEDEQTDSERVELLLHYNVKRGIQAFDRCFERGNSMAISRCARRLPDEWKDRYYDKMLSLLYKHADMMTESVLFFICDCNNKKAADLADYACKQMDANILKTVIYTMGKCLDWVKCIDMFIDWMKSDEYWIAHTALQAVSRKKHPKLLPVFQWMLEKYKDDSMMLSNLKIAMGK